MDAQTIWINKEYTTVTEVGTDIYITHDLTQELWDKIKVSFTSTNEYDDSHNRLFIANELVS